MVPCRGIMEDLAKDLESIEKWFFKYGLHVSAGLLRQPRPLFPRNAGSRVSIARLRV